MKRVYSRTSKSDTFYLWLFVAPVLIIILVAQVYPLIYSLVVSLRHWSLAESLTAYGFTFSNYISIVKDPSFISSIKISAQFMIVTTIFEIFIGFVLGYLLNKNSFFIKICRTVLLIPMVIAPIAVGIIWRMFLDSNNGLLNYLLHFIGITGPNWLGEYHYALISAMMVDIWQWSSFAMIIYVASMSSISQDIIESANIDGASRLKVISKIIWPLVAPATILILIFRIIDTFFVFDAIYTLTYGGPGSSTQVVTLYIYNEGLKYFNISKAAAASWIVMIVAVAIAFSLLKIKSKVEKSIY